MSSLGYLHAIWNVIPLVYIALSIMIKKCHSLPGYEGKAEYIPLITCFAQSRAILLVVSYLI